MTAKKLKRWNRLARSSKYKSKNILKILAVQPGSIIADVGSGGGYYTLLFAQAAGPHGKAVAVDIDPENLSFIKLQAEGMKLGNVETFVTAPDHLTLPSQACNLIFMRNMFHHLPAPEDYFASLAEYLKPDGRVAIIDYKEVSGFSLSFASRHRHFSDPARICAVMQQSGLELAGSYDFLSNQSFQIFKHA